MRATTITTGCFAAVLMSATFSASGAQPYQEYRKHIETAQNLTALTDELMGDSVSLYNGATEFTAIDIDLPGNSALPVQLRRRFSVEIVPGGSPGSPAGDPNYRGAGNWDIDVPYISATWAQGPWESARCSAGNFPSAPAPLDPTDIWQGNTAHLPGRGDVRLLKLQSVEIPQPDGVARKWTTRERDMVSCIPMHGAPADEGFLLQTQDGLKYYFDVATTRYAGNMVYQPSKDLQPFSVSRTKYYLLARRVEDRFGNFVEFTYNPAGHPTKIESNDDRVINLVYVNGRLATAEANGRTWSYGYGTAGDNVGMLTTVTLPDASKWQYAHAGTLFPDEGEQWDGGTGSRCSISPPYVPASFTFAATHPGGATGTFQFENFRHPRSGIHVNACLPRPIGPVQTYKLALPNYFDVMTLKSKTLSGPGLDARTWNYSHPMGSVPLWGTRGANQPYPCTECSASKIVTVNEPGGIKKRYRFGHLYADNEGRLLETVTLDANDVVRRTETTVYLPETEVVGQNFHPVYGTGYGSSDPSSLAVRPIIEKVVEQDGEIYAKTVKKGCGGANLYCFDQYAMPTAETQVSSLGYSRDELTEYKNDAFHWILGQPSKKTIGGVVVSETNFDSLARPSTIKTYGKVSQILTYYQTAGPDDTQWGTVASVSDGRDASDLNTTVALSNWKRGIPQTITHPATIDQPTSVSQSAVVNNNGWITSVTDENGYRTCYDYDDMGRLNEIKYPSETQLNTCNTSAWALTTSSFVQEPTETEYGIPGGHWKQTVSTGDAQKVTYFDAMWRPLVQETFDASDDDNTRSVVVKRYDSGGRLAFQSYPMRTLGSYGAASLLGVKTAYDALDRATSVTQDSEYGPLITATAYVPADGSAHAHVKVTDPQVNVTKTWFQAFDQPSLDTPVAIQHPEGAFTDIVRDLLGKAKSITRRNANSSIAATRSYVYDGNQRLCKMIEPETGATVMAYDAADNVVWSASGQEYPSTTTCNAADVPVAQRVARNYDTRGRVKGIAFPDGLGNTTYEYTPDNLVAKLQVDNGGVELVTTDYTYNRRRLLKSDRLRFGARDWTQEYDYNNRGQLSALTYPDELQVAYAPNALGQPTQAGSYALGVSYFPNGGMSGFTYGNGIVHTMIPNDRQLPERSIDSGGVLDDTYLYDASGNVDSITDGLTGHRGNRTMTYDGLNRLKTVTSPMFPGGALYNYDVLDNLTRVKAPARDHTYSYSPQWRLETILNTSNGSAVTNLAYDDQGNLQSKGGQQFVFDRGNRLRAATGQETYAYDGQGRRVRATHPVQGSIYSFYGQDGALRFQHDERTGKATSYVTLNGSLIARVSNIVAPPVPVLTVPASSNSGSYTASWAAVPGATRYELQERIGGGGGWTEVYDGSGLSKAFSGKSPALYSYQLRACSASACGGWSAVAQVSVALPPASIPVITAPETAFNGNYMVSWTASPGATSYTLQELSKLPWSEQHEGLSRSFTGMASGSYKYRVQACNASGCSGYSSIVQVQSVHSPSAAPSLTVPGSSTSGAYSVSWTSVARATSYLLEEQLNSGSWTPFASTASTTSTLSGRANGTYRYRVKACNGAGCGPLSSTAAITVLLPPGAAPAVSVPSTNTTGSYTVTWTTVATSTSYEIQQSTNGGAWASLYTGASTSQAVSGRATGSYGYRARACNVSGCSGYSPTRTVAVTRAPASAPTLTAPSSSSTGDITVSWTTVPEAASYTLEEESPLTTTGWAAIQTNATTTMALTDRVAGVWQYRVKACNSVGCGPYSVVKSVSSTVVAPPPVPTGLVAVPDGIGCDVSWNASAGAINYELKKNFVIYSGEMNQVTLDYQCPSPLQVRACNATICSAWSP